MVGTQLLKGVDSTIPVTTSCGEEGLSAATTPRVRCGEQRVHYSLEPVGRRGGCGLVVCVCVGERGMGHRQECGCSAREELQGSR